MIQLNRRALIRLASGTAAASLAVPAVHAQESDAFPSKPIRLLLGFPPGGAIDLLARALTKKWTEQLGQPFVIEHRPGAGTQIATQALARSAPDGYTLTFVGPGHASNAAMYRKLPYDTMADFEFVGTATMTTTVLVVDPVLNVRSVADLIALARSRPGALNYASSSTTSLLAAELFKMATGLNIVGIPFKGTAEGLREMLAGRVQMTIDGLAAWLPHIREGRLRALAVGTPQRFPLLPDVPTLDEAGLKGFTVPGWTGFLAPARTPAAILGKLNRTLNVALQQADLRTTLLQQASVPHGGTPEEFRRTVHVEVSRLNQAIDAAGIARE